MKCSECRHADCGWCFAGRDRQEYLSNLKDPDFDWLENKPPEIHRDMECWNGKFERRISKLILPDGRVAGGAGLSPSGVVALMSVGIKLKHYGTCSVKRITRHTVWLEKNENLRVDC